MKSLPEVESMIGLGITALASIQAFVDSSHLDDSKKGRIDEALQVARNALSAISSALGGAKDISDATLQAAVQDFQRAYQAVLDLLQTIGVTTSSKNTV